MKVTDNIYGLNSTKGNYAYLIKSKDLILIDTGLPGQGNNILKELEAMEIKPTQIKHILITHHDIDHVGNLALLEKETKATVWASKEDIPYICGKKHRHGLKRFLSFIMREKRPHKIRPYPQDNMVQDVEIIHTPGHTPGHVSLLYKDILFVGDLLRTSKGHLEPMRTFMNWDTSLANISLEKVADLDFKWICPAHGEPLEKDTIEL